MCRFWGLTLLAWNVWSNEECICISNNLWVPPVVAFIQLLAPSILIKFQLTPLHSKNWGNYAFIRVFSCSHHAIDTFIWCMLPIESQWIFWFPKLKYFMTTLDMSQTCLWCFQKTDDKLNEICLWRPEIIVFIKR